MQFGAEHRVAQGTTGPCLKSSLSTPSSLKAQQKRKSRCLVEREPVLLRPTGELACVQPSGALLSVFLFHVEKTTNTGLSLLLRTRCAIPPRSQSSYQANSHPATPQRENPASCEAPRALPGGPAPLTLHTSSWQVEDERHRDKDGARFPLQAGCG